MFDFFDFLTMLGGVCLFLFGMTLMGEALERRAGSSLESMLGKMTTGKAAGFLTRDSRMNERKKYGLKAARRASQFSKR